MKERRQLVFFMDYFYDFFNPLSEKVKDKIDQVLFMIRLADRIPGKFFKQLKGTEGLYEIRVEYQGNIYRIFSSAQFTRSMVAVNFTGFPVSVADNRPYTLLVMFGMLTSSLRMMFLLILINLVTF